jgi:hypothetical protein
LGVKIPGIPKISDKSEGNKLGLNCPPTIYHSKGLEVKMLEMNSHSPFEVVR